MAMNKSDSQINKPVFSLGILVLYLILLFSNLLPGDLFSPMFILIGVTLLVLSRGKIKNSYFNFVKPLIGIFILGICGIFGHDSRHVLRDLIYALTPISLIYIGYRMADNKRMWPHILNIIILFGIVFSLIHLSNFLFEPSLFGEKIDDIRKLVYNPGGSLILLSFLIGLFQNRIGFGNLFPKFLPRVIVLPLLFLSFFLAYSRTGLFVAIILSFSILGYLSRINIKSIISIVILITGLFFIVITTPTGEVGTFRSKIGKSLKEIAVSDYQDMADINSNWRGFETYRALITFTTGNLNQQIFGHGFGSLIDLGFDMPLNEVVYRKIPILHNGYAYILVKTGLIGILFYVLFFYRIIRFAVTNNNSLNPEKVQLSRLSLGLALSLLFSMVVVGGMAQIHDSEFVLFLGYIIRRIEQL